GAGRATRAAVAIPAAIRVASSRLRARSVSARRRTVRAVLSRFCTMAATSPEVCTPPVRFNSPPAQKRTARRRPCPRPPRRSSDRLPAVFDERLFVRLERWEVALAEAALRAPDRLPRDREAALRWALGLARLRDGGGADLLGRLERFRGDVVRTLTPVFENGVDLEAAALLAPVLAARTASELKALAAVADRGAIEEEIRQKRLVLALGGGGGSAWAHLGAFSLLEEEGLRPALLAGASMGAVLALLRARSAIYDAGDALHAVRSLSLRRLLRPEA